MIFVQRVNLQMENENLWMTSGLMSQRNTVFALSGLMIGALNKMWPWQFDGNNYLPNDFSKSLGIENYMELSILFILISFILSYSLKPIK